MQESKDQNMDQDATALRWPPAWPASGPKFQTRLVYLDALTEDDAERSWPLLADRINAELFVLAYGRACSGPLDLKTKFADHIRDPYMYGYAFAIYYRPTREYMGWVSLTPPARNTHDPVSWSIYLPQGLRLNRGFDTMFIMTQHAFEVIGHDLIRARLGTEDGNPGDLGLTVLGVMRRQCVVTERDSKSEIMIIPKSRWPEMKVVSAALLVETPGAGETPEALGFGRGLTWGPTHPHCGP